MNLIPFRRFRQLIFENSACLTCALRYDGKVYKGEPGQAHHQMAALAQIHVQKDFDSVHNTLERGYVDERGNYLKPHQAFKYAHQNFLLTRDAAKEAYSLTPAQYAKRGLDTPELKNSNYWKKDTLKEEEGYLTFKGDQGTGHRDLINRARERSC